MVRQGGDQLEGWRCCLSDMSICRLLTWRERRGRSRPSPKEPPSQFTSVTCPPPFPGPCHSSEENGGSYCRGKPTSVTGYNCGRKDRLDQVYYCGILRPCLVPPLRKSSMGEGIFGQPEGQDYMISPWRGEGTAGKTSCAVSGQGKAGWDALEPTSAFMAKCA